MESRLTTLLFILLTVSLSGCSGVQSRTDQPEEVAEIMPGLLQGYVPQEEILDSKRFLLPAPGANSARQALDTSVSKKALSLRGTPRWDLAKSDADLSFPAAASHFSCVLGIAVSEEDTPTLYMLLRRTLTDVGLAPYSAKNAYQRKRPFMVNGAPICTPDEEAALRKDGSYPSGHSAVGWGWALILAELAPDRAEQILDRGRTFGESRNVCNVHWYSDVVAGRLVGAAAVATLHAEEQFADTMDAAEEDINRARSEGLSPKKDCQAEASALSQGLF